MNTDNIIMVNVGLIEDDDGNIVDSCIVVTDGTSGLELTIPQARELADALAAAANRAEALLGPFKEVIK